MNTQPLALALAHWLERDGANCQQHIDAAAELRRLHEAHEWQYTMAGERLRRVEKLEAEVHAWVKENSPGGWIDNLRAENEALRTALKAVMALPAMNNSGDGTMEFYHAVRAADALARAGEKT
jgi:hypothetical protein